MWWVKEKRWYKVLGVEWTYYQDRGFRGRNKRAKVLGLWKLVDHNREYKGIDED